MQDVEKLLKEKYNIKCTLGCGVREGRNNCYAIAHTAKQANKWCEKLRGTWILTQGAYVVHWIEPDEPAVKDWLDMIQKSWTWGKLSEEERKDFLTLLDHPQSNQVIFGDYEQCKNACEALYYAFLCGKGYTRNPIDWRDNRAMPEPKPTKETIKQVLKYVGGHLDEVLQD